jgi:PD-(D/E)XK endonuclease
VLTTDQKGAIAEAAIALEAIKLGIDVYRPVAEGGRFDMIFVVGERLVRVQCKWAPLSGDTIVVRCYSNRRAREGLRRRRYPAEEIDAYAAYCPEVDRCYYLPYRSFGGRTQVLLRLSPTRNNQRSLINWAKDFEFAATLGRHHGAIAQLGERQLGMLEVAGSSPAGSIENGARANPRPALFSVD